MDINAKKAKILKGLSILKEQVKDSQGDIDLKGLYEICEILDIGNALYLDPELVFVLIENKLSTVKFPARLVAIEKILSDMLLEVDTVNATNPFQKDHESTRIENVGDHNDVFLFNKNSIDNKMNDTLSLKFIERLIPNFDGSSDVRDFCNIVDDLYGQCPPNQLNTFFMTVKYKLQGSAKAILSGSQTYTWPELKDKLVQIYQPEDNNRASNNEFMTCFQLPDKSVQNYAARVSIAKRNMIDNLPETLKHRSHEIIEYQALSVFVNELRPEYKQIFKFRAVDTLEDAIRIAKTEETTIKVDNLNQKNQIKCSYCHKTGHIVQNCFSLTKIKENQNSSFSNNNFNYSRPQFSQNGQNNQNRNVNRNGFQPRSQNNDLQRFPGYAQQNNGNNGNNIRPFFPRERNHYAPRDYNFGSGNQKGNSQSPRPNNNFHQNRNYNNAQQNTNNNYVEPIREFRQHEPLPIDFYNNPHNNGPQSRGRPQAFLGGAANNYDYIMSNNFNENSNFRDRLPSPCNNSNSCCDGCYAAPGTLNVSSDFRNAISDSQNQLQSFRDHSVTSHVVPNNINEPSATFNDNSNFQGRPQAFINNTFHCGNNDSHLASGSNESKFTELISGLSDLFKTKQDSNQALNSIDLNLTAGSSGSE